MYMKMRSSSPPSDRYGASRNQQRGAGAPVDAVEASSGRPAVLVGAEHPRLRKPAREPQVLAAQRPQRGNRPQERTGAPCSSTSSGCDRGQRRLVGRRGEQALEIVRFDPAVGIEEQQRRRQRDRQALVDATREATVVGIGEHAHAGPRCRQPFHRAVLGAVVDQHDLERDAPRAARQRFETGGQHGARAKAHQHHREARDHDGCSSTRRAEPAPAAPLASATRAPPPTCRHATRRAP